MGPREPNLQRKPQVPERLPNEQGGIGPLQEALQELHQGLHPLAGQHGQWHL